MFPSAHAAKNALSLAKSCAKIGVASLTEDSRRRAAPLLVQEFHFPWMLGSPTPMNEWLGELSRAELARLGRASPELSAPSLFILGSVRACPEGGPFWRLFCDKSLKCAT